MSDDLEAHDLHHETMQALMVAVRTAADRMKSRLPVCVDVNDVVSAGYLALTQALAYWQDASDETFEAHALNRASAAMVAASRNSSPPSINGRRFANEMASVQRSLTDAFEPAFGATEEPPAIDTLVSPPRNSEEPETTRSHVEATADSDIAMEEIGVHVA
jgi:DNA-directed RNA polymerase specialized sigma subunit